MPDIPAAITGRIRTNIARGRTARRALGEKLAELPPERAAKLPRAVLARIAPDAMSILASAAAGTDEISPAGNPAIARERGNASEGSALPPWAGSVAAAVLVILITLIVGPLERPTRWLLASTGALSADQAGLCARLDRWTDRCSYSLGDSHFSLEQIAGAVGMSIEDVAATNIALPRSVSLPVHTKIAINRSYRR